MTTNLERQELRVIAQRLLMACVVLLSAADVSADDSDPVHVVYDRERGELSPGTAAPKREQMVNAVKSATPTRLQATLEYGERVECFECIPLLADKLLSSDSAQVREIAAWWLRRRSFGFGPVMVKMLEVARADSDPVRRARAAAALGEFLDPHAAELLGTVALTDVDASVRVAAVQALGRLNTLQVHDAISGALGDSDASVRLAALNQVLKLNFYRDTAAQLALLADADREVRRTAVQLAGEQRLAAASDVLVGTLMTDDSPQVRQAAAIALGRIGGGDASDALSAAQKSERDPSVLNAIAIAVQMR